MGRPRLPIGTWGAITVTRNRAGGWRARTRYRDLDGVVRHVEGHGETKGAARSNLMVKLTSRSLPAAASTFADLARRWEDRADSMPARPQSRARYLSALRLHVIPAMGNVEVREINAALLDRVLADIHRRTPGVEGTCRTVLSHVMRLAVMEGLLQASPMDAVPRRRATPADVRRVTVDDIAELRRRAAAWTSADRRRTTPLLDVIDVLLSTGLRAGELLSLTWGDVDLDAGTITVGATQVHIKGQGIVRQDETKERKEIRHLLTGWAIEALQRRAAAAPDARPEHYVFAAARSGGTRMISESNLNRAFRDARGDEYAWVTWHTFRKAVGQAVADVGGVGMAARVLGHSGTSVTRAHYVGRAELAPDVRADLEGRFSGAVRGDDGDGAGDGP